MSNRVNAILEEKPVYDPRPIYVLEIVTPTNIRYELDDDLLRNYHDVCELATKIKANIHSKRWLLDWDVKDIIRCIESGGQQIENCELIILLMADCEYGHGRQLVRSWKLT